MIFFAGSRRIGFLTILTALLLPALGVVGVASADMSVGDTIMLKVPDLSEFPQPIEEHQFTCRAVTEHAYWLVQDTVSCPGAGPGVLDTLVWDNLMDQEELDALTDDFEGSGVDVYGTVVDYLGDIPDTDGDPRIWIIMATIRDQHSQSPSDRMVMAWVNPLDVDGSGGFNNHDCFYINIHTYTNTPTVLEIAKQLRMFYIPTGLGMLLRTAVKPTEDLWIVRGLGAVCQYLCYGMTNTTPGNMGLINDTNQFAKASYLELTYWMAGGHTSDYANSRGQEFLWFMYLVQRIDDSILESVAQSDTTEMLNVARAIDSSVADSVAIQTNVVPIYNDWLVCNLVSNYRDDMLGGIYTYEILSDTTYTFGHIGNPGAFEGSFSSYPLDVWVPEEGHGLTAPIWAAQYDEFLSGYSGYLTVYFNGMFSDGGGSGSVIDGKWYGSVVTLDTVSTEIISVTELSLNDVYNGSFSLAGDNSYIILTNNNEGGLSDLRYALSQDTDEPNVLLSGHQNKVNDQFVTLYTSLFDEEPEGFDWYGPIFTAHHPESDSTGLFTMSSFYGTIWNCRFSAWVSGAYTLQVAGYDTTGFSIDNSIDIDVGYTSSDGLSLEVNCIHLDIPGGSVAPGARVSMCESSMLGLSIESQKPVEDVAGQMSGILAGPVSIPSIDATISFPADNSEGAVYRYIADGWCKLDSWFQNGRMYACVSEGGHYVYGQTPGVTSPEIPAEFRFGGTYPNPFSAEAAIRFSMPSSGRVNVTIYDMSGRVIRTLSDTEMQAAEHTLVWDGRDAAGNAVGAGVYFCRLQACGETITQKMLRIE